MANTLSSVNPLYYVLFTSAVLAASFIMFQGFNTSNPVNTISLIVGFITIFLGVYLLNLSRMDPTGHRLIHNDENGIPTDPLSAGIQARLSLQSRRSTERHRRSVSGGGLGFSPRLSRGDRERLMGSYDVEQQFGLTDLAEDSDEEMSRANGTSGIRMNGSAVPPRQGR